MHLPHFVRQQLELPRRRLVARLLVQQIMVGLGALMAALGYVVFQTPHNLAAGGVSGLGIIVNHYTGFSVGTFYLVVNVPLFIWGFFSLGRWSFLWSSTVAVAVFSMASDLLAWRLPEVLDSWPITNDALLSAIYAGALYGLGTGIIYRYGGTIGGSSISARIIYNKTGFPLSQSYLFTDLAVVLASGLVFNWETALLAAMTLMLCGIFSNYALEGTSQVRTLMIITEKPDPIRLALMHELQRGVTHWEVTGGYSGTVRTMLYFTVLRSRVYDVKHIVSRLDPDAFMVVGLAHQAWGGYNAPKLEDRE